MSPRPTLLDLVHVGDGRDSKEPLKVGRTGHSGGPPLTCPPDERGGYSRGGIGAVV